MINLNIFHWLSAASGVFAAIFTGNSWINPGRPADAAIALGLDVVSIAFCIFAIVLSQKTSKQGGEKHMGISLKVAIGLIACVCIGMATAVVLNSYVFPTSYTVQSTALTFYLDNVEWTNNTAIDWGWVVPGATYVYTNFTIVNTGTTVVNVTHHTLNLAQGFNQTYSAHGTVLQPTNKTMGTLTLEVPLTAPPGTGSHTTYIYAEQPE